MKKACAIFLLILITIQLSACTSIEFKKAIAKRNFDNVTISLEHTETDFGYEE